MKFFIGIQEEFITSKINEKLKSERINSQAFQETIEIHIPIQLTVLEEYHLVPIKPRSISPEEREHSDMRFRNEKQIMVDEQHQNNYNNNNANNFTMSGFQQNQDFNGQFNNQLASFRMLSNNMRQYFDQRLNRFETDFDLNFFKDEENNFDMIEGSDQEHHNHPDHQFNLSEPRMIEVEPYHTVPHHVIHVDHTGADHNSMMNNMVQNGGCQIFHNYQVNSENNNSFHHQRIQAAVLVNGSANNNRQRKSSVTNLMYVRVVDGNIITSI